MKNKKTKSGTDVRQVADDTNSNCDRINGSSHPEQGFPRHVHNAIVLPNMQTADDGAYFSLDPSVTGFDRSYLNRSNYKTGNCFEDNTKNGDGWYSKISETQTFEKDAALYSHCKDTVCHTSEHTRKNLRNEDTYDHFFGLKTEDDYDITSRL